MTGRHCEKAATLDEEDRKKTGGGLSGVFNFLLHFTFQDHKNSHFEKLH